MDLCKKKPKNKEIFVKVLQRFALSVFLSLLPGLALAADFDGSQLSAWWGVPFAGILL